jgi:hypothetical protein
MSGMSIACCTSVTPIDRHTANTIRKFELVIFVLGSGVDPQPSGAAIGFFV